MKLEFKETGTFNALYAAQTWLNEHGYSYGSLCRDEPVGILKGEFSIAKWRNLTPSERRQLDGTLTSNDFREGPVVVELKDA